VQFARDLLVFLPVQADVVLVGPSREDAARVEVEEANAADVVSGGVLVEQGELEEDLRGGPEGDGDGFVPDDLGVLLALGDLGLVLGSAARRAQYAHAHVVLHLARDVIVLLEHAVGDGQLHSRHIQ
jgi:hypothetical protein